MNSQPNAHSGISRCEILFVLKPRPLHNTTPFLEYDHEKMYEARLTIKELVDDIQLYKSRRATANPPPTPLTVGLKVIVVRDPNFIINLIGQTCANLEHTVSGETLRCPRKWLRPLLERKEDRNGRSRNSFNISNKRKSYRIMKKLNRKNLTRTKKPAKKRPKRKKKPLQSIRGKRGDYSTG